MSYSGKGNIYVKNTSTIAGEKEKDSPLSSYFDQIISEDYKGTFEQSEAKRISICIETLLKKSNLKKHEVDFYMGGDLSDQLGVSHAAFKNWNVPFIGVYGACSTITLSMILAMHLLKKDQISHAIAFSSSSYAVAERQFRYPLEYGIQRRKTSEHTVTGVGAILLTNQETEIILSEFTIGDIEDISWDNVQDMGTPMAFACYQTIRQHLYAFHRKVDDYDLILSGDLSKIGAEILLECFQKDGYPLSNYKDAGIWIYQSDQDDVESGGSGAGCLPLVAFSKVYQDLKNGIYRRVLLVATGALFSPTMIHQNDTIPVIAHAITLERNEK